MRLRGTGKGNIIFRNVADVIYAWSLEAAGLVGLVLRGVPGEGAACVRHPLLRVERRVQVVPGDDSWRWYDSKKVTSFGCRLSKSKALFIY